MSGDYARRGVDVAPERLVLTGSTSEAYSLLFKLLCDPGDAVLAPRPSYPLIEHLAALDAVAVEPFDLDSDACWAVDPAELSRRLERRVEGPQVKAVVLISPDNPTGSIVTPGAIAEIAASARAHGAALIVDEVFADYVFGGARHTSALTQSGALTFALGGLSKTAGLPQVKLGWIGVSGPGDEVADALSRLEVICDAYLSVGLPVQFAAGELLSAGAPVRRQIQHRVRENRAALLAAAEGHPSCRVLRADGGWYGVVQVPAVRPEEDLVLDLLDRTGILVHPGYFYDFQREAFVVMSLLPEPELFAGALAPLFSLAGRA